VKISIGILHFTQASDIIPSSKRRDGRAAEGAPLLREYRVKSSIEGSNPSLSANFYFLALSNMENPARLKFLCRRGMKELDEILNPFFDEHYKDLDPALKQDFAELLNQEEPCLFDWLILNKPPHTAFKKIVDVIISS
jgi:antitoxin CptB